MVSHFLKHPVHLFVFKASLKYVEFNMVVTSDTIMHFLYLCLIAYLSSCTRKRSNRYNELAEDLTGHMSTTLKMGESRLVPFPTAQQVNLSACFPHCLFYAERQAGKL